MSKIIDKNAGMGTIVNHVGEGGHDKHAHLMPIYQTSTFGFDTVDDAADVFAGRVKGYAYTRTHNPNMDHLANKIAIRPCHGESDVIRHGCDLGGGVRRCWRRR